MAENNQTKSLSEDWTAVIIGFIIIAATLAGMVLTGVNYNWDTTTELVNFFQAKNLQSLLLIFLSTFVLTGISFLLLGKPVVPLTKSFPIIFFLALAAQLIAGSTFTRYFNLEAVIICLAIGLVVGNLISLPEWFRNSLSTELFVKVGLILLGCSIIFSDILKAGAAGLVQALIVVIAVWYFAYWLCKRFRIDQELTFMLASAVSICGVSAAIATAGAIQGDSKKLSYVVSLVLITAIPMMIGMPYLAGLMGLSEEVTGAWLGGTIDTTGAVVASGSLVGQRALEISTIVKFSQNVLLGIAAFAISVYWAYTRQKAQTVNVGMIWHRFPKFVIGFVLASLLFSFLVSTNTLATVKGSLKNLQNVWFALAFVSIGLETRFKDLWAHHNRKPLYAFLIAQAFNILVTLIIAYFLFR